MSIPKMTEGQVCQILSANYTGAKYVLSNTYIYAADWETDLFVLRMNGYSLEFEIKVTRSDFMADAKKVKKHQILKDGKYILQHKGNASKVVKIHNFRPNKFYYAVPAGMIQIDEVPKYAGLIYIYPATRSAVVVKNAPFIHRDILSYEKKLCQKFYFHWLAERSKFRELKIKYDNLIKYGK